MEWTSRNRDRRQEHREVVQMVLEVRQPEISVHRGRYLPLHANSADEFCRQIRGEGGRYDKGDVTDSEQTNETLADYSNGDWRTNTGGQRVIRIVCKESARSCR